MSAEVREMFASIARRYDTANEVSRWASTRAGAALQLPSRGPVAGSGSWIARRGTGDLALEFKRAVEPKAR